MISAEEIIARTRAFAAAFGAHDAEACAAFYAPDATWSNGSYSLQGRAAIAALYADLFTGIPDARIQFTSILTPRPDASVSQWVLSGTQNGVLKLGPERTAFAPSGRAVSLPGVSILSFNQGGLISKHEGRWNTLALLSQIGVPSGPALTEGDARGLAEKLIAAYNRRDAAAAAACYAENVVHVVGGEAPQVGRQALQEWVQAYMNAFPDLQATATDVLVQNNVVTICYSVRATHTGPLGPIPATGRRVEMTGVEVVTVGPGGLIEHSKEYFDHAALLQQLGVLPR